MTTERRRFSVFSHTLSQALKPVLKPICKQHGFAQSRVLTEWESVVGCDLAKGSVPQKISFPRGRKEGGTLEILTSNARALELSHMQPVILDRINTYFGYKAVEKLRFIDGLHARPRASAMPVARLKRGANTLSSLAAACDDADLRRALTSLGAALETK